MKSTLAALPAKLQGSDAEGGHEADWDVPASPDNSTLSRILGLVLVVVLARVFSFVAYRKYQEAKLNPAAKLTVDATAPGTEAAAGEKHADVSNSPFDGEHEGNTQGNVSGVCQAHRRERPASRTWAAIRLTRLVRSTSRVQSAARIRPSEIGSRIARARAPSPATPAGHLVFAGGHEADANPFRRFGWTARASAATGPRPVGARAAGWPAVRLPLRLPLTMRRREGKPSRAANFRRTAELFGICDGIHRPKPFPAALGGGVVECRVRADAPGRVS